MREIIVERSSEILRIAIRHKGKLQEIIVEEEKNGPIAGEIYKGRIRNIVGATNSVFVDIGSDKDVYLYYSNELKKQNIKKGDEVIVEISSTAITIFPIIPFIFITPFPLIYRTYDN